MSNEDYEKMQDNMHYQIEELKKDLQDPSKRKVNEEYIKMSFVRIGE